LTKTMSQVAAGPFVPDDTSGMRWPNVAIAYIEPIAEQVCNLRGQDEAWILSTFGSCATATPVAQPSGAASAAIASLGPADFEPELMHAVGSTHPTLSMMVHSQVTIQTMRLVWL
jgi:hypothetical protein